MAHPWLVVGSVLFYLLLSSGVVVLTEEIAGPQSKWARSLVFILWPALIVFGVLFGIGRLVWERFVEARR